MLQNTALEATKVGNIDAISSTNGKEIKYNIRFFFFTCNVTYINEENGSLWIHCNISDMKIKGT
jgi:hypothetical protein